VLLAVGAWFSADASALTTFGADLNRPANTGFDCGVGPGAGALGQPVYYPTNVTSCTWLAAGRNFGQLESSLVPSGQGTVTNVRVRVGPITGPMQVVVLRAVRSAQGPVGTTPGGAGVNAACCKEVGRSGVFVPAPNAVTNIAVNLPVKSDIVPNPISLAYDFDMLGLSVLAPGVPIPAHDVGTYQDVTGPIAHAYFPAMLPGQERADSFGTLGYQLLLQADWEPVQVAGGTAAAAITLVVPAASVTRRFLRLSLRCNQATPCVGALNVQTGGAGAAVVSRLIGSAKAKRKRVVTIAKAKLRISAGGTARIKAKLTRKGRRIVRRKKRPKLYANVRLAGKLVLSSPIALKKKK
jgi:hypothetical protein